MSRSTQLLKELFTGCHLVAITKVSQGELTDIIIRFSDGANKSYDKVYDYTSSEFLKMANSGGLLKNNAVFSSKEALGARLWLCIKEVWDVRGTEMLDTVNFYVFDTRPCIDPEKKPIIKGDPADNKGVPSGVFYDCKQVQTRSGEDGEYKVYAPVPLEEIVEPLLEDIDKINDNIDVIVKNGEIKSITITASGSGYTSKPAPTGNPVVDSMLGLNSDPFDLPPSKPKKAELPAEKKKVIQAAKEMIKQVESGIKEEVKQTPDEDWDEM